jgi:hypothetical protein
MSGPIPIEPTDELIEAALIACGLTPKFRAQTMDAVRKHRGTPNEPTVCCEVRAVLAVLNGVPLSEIKRGYRR